MAMRALNVLFAVAAGPRIGFGHLARSRALARALGVRPLVALRGSLGTRAAVADREWTLLSDVRDAALRREAFDLIVIDDPSQDHAYAWLRKARRMGVTAVSIHDRGLAAIDADVVVDGSIRPGPALGRIGSLCGPRFAILDPRIGDLRAQHRNPVPNRVLIALGGGRHVHGLAEQLCAALAERVPSIDIRVARGFTAPAVLPSLRRGQWIDVTDGLGSELASCSAAIVAGGITLYEACALGVPAVALAVTAAQHDTIRGFACHGAVIDAGWPLSDLVVARAADAIATIGVNDRVRDGLSKQSARLVDGDGACRVAAQLRGLLGLEEATDAA